MTWLYKRPRLTIALMTMVVLGFGHRALFIVQDNSPDTLFSAEPTAKQTYQELVRTFGGDEVVLVQLRGARPDRAADLLAVARLDRRMSAAHGVVHVLSPAQIFSPGMVDAAGEPTLPTPEQLSAVQRELEAIPLYRELGLYQRDAPTLGAIALVAMKGPTARAQLATSLNAIRAEFAKQGYRVLVAGLAPANAAVDRELRRSLTIFMPLVALVAVLIGWIMFRSVRILFAMFLPVAGAVILGVAFLEMAGQSLNLITAIMPPLVLAISFAGAIHLVSHYAASCAQSGLERRAAVRQTIREKFAPTAFAYATTAIGFGSLALSHMPSVRVLGIGAAAALLTALVLVTVGTPTLILLLKPKLCMPAHRQAILQRVALTSLRHRWSVLSVAGLVTGILIFGTTRLETNINGMDFLPADTPERADYQQLEREGLGLGNIDIWIHKPVPQATLLADAARLADMAEELADVASITGSAGVHDLLTIIGYRMNGNPVLPASLAPLAILDASSRARVDRLLRLYWHPEKGLKLTLLSITGDETVNALQRRRILAAAKQHFPEHEVDISGHYAMLINTPGEVTDTLVSSLTLTVAIVAILFLLAFRSPWLVLGGMVANLLPVLAMLGTMGLLGVSMDVATVMIGSVAFGLAVDDTFHYLYHRRKSGSIVQAANIAGQGIVATTFVIAGGFAMLGLSGFNPVVRLGLLLAYGALMALVVDAVLLPALVGRRDEVAEAEAPLPPRE